MCREKSTVQHVNNWEICMTFWSCVYKFSVKVFQNRELKRETTVVHKSCAVMQFKKSKKLVPRPIHSTGMCYAPTARQTGLGTGMQGTKAPV